MAEDSSFVKMDKSEKIIPGNPMLIVCGFKPKEQDLFKKVIKKCHITVPFVFPGRRFQF